MYYVLGSYGYTGEDVSYVWAEQPLSMDELGLAQYHMTAWTYGVETSLTKQVHISLRTRAFSPSKGMLHDNS